MSHATRSWFWLVACLAASSPTSARLLVSEVMYNPLSNEDRWEWLEVHNTGTAAIDLDGFFVDRVGDRERVEPIPNISSRPLVGTQTVDNPTVVPAGGIAVLYNGDALAYDPSRFRAAWPNMPLGTPLVGVRGWAANQLTNSPEPSDFAPSLPAMTVGLWADEASYRADAEDFGTPSAPNRRVFRTDNAAATFGYDDDPPWRDVEGRKSLIYLGGDVLSVTSWGRSNAPYAGAAESTPTYQQAPVNLPDFGSPGTPPPGTAPVGNLIVTEILYNPATSTGATNEWEWVELYNNGPSIDFSQNPYWFDDDDGDNLETPNLTTGRIDSGETIVLFNATAVSLGDMRTAWGRAGEPPIDFVPVEAWPTLNNSGDVVGFWDSASDYGADRDAGETVGRAVAGVVYDNSDPWPTGTDGDAIRLINLGTAPQDPGAWARARGDSADLDAWQTNDVFGPTGLIDNKGGDQGSPGFVWPDLTSPLPGDYNRDGAVDAADYTLWRDGEPLPTERASVGVNDEADYEDWALWYGFGPGGAVTVPEPAGWIVLLCSAGCLRGRW